jgi:hypothetical protein
MALTCWRCSGHTELDHARDCPDRTAPVPSVVELSWPNDEDGRPVSFERAVELAAALDEDVRQPLYWVQFTDTVDDRDLDGQTTRLEDTAHTLPAIRRYCEHYSVGAVYGDESGALGAVTRTGEVVPGAANAPDAASR